MKSIKPLILFCCFTFFTAYHCQDEKIDSLKKEGIVLFYGDPATDGCGWMINIDDIVYSPTNIESKFLQDSLKVVLSYKELTTNWKCGWREPGFKQIEIIDMKTKSK